jgi:hypothetical protein
MPVFGDGDQILQVPKTQSGDCHSWKLSRPARLSIGGFRSPLLYL